MDIFLILLNCTIAEAQEALDDGVYPVMRSVVHSKTNVEMEAYVYLGDGRGTLYGTREPDSVLMEALMERGFQLPEQYG